MTKLRTDAWEAALTMEQCDQVFERMSNPGFRWSDVSGWAAEEFSVPAPSRAAIYRFVERWRPEYIARRTEERATAYGALREQREQLGDVSAETIFHLENEAKGYIARGDLKAGHRLYAIASHIRDDIRTGMELKLKEQAEARAQASLQLDREKFEEQKRRNAQAREKLEEVVSKGGLSDETIRKIEETMGLL